MRLPGGTTYLDANATTPLAPEVALSLSAASAEYFANPSSAHSPGRSAREALERSRFSLSHLVGCSPEEVVFTSSGTEANHLAWNSALSAARGRKKILISCIEHPSVSEQAELWGESFEVLEIPVDGAGVLELDSLKAMLSRDVALLSVMTAHNETGVLQPVAAAGEMAREAGVLFHTDAVQAAGKIALPWNWASPDYLTLSGHKFYGPKGVGVLVARKGAPVRAMLVGGGQEKGRRSSTEAVPLAVALGVASDLAFDGRDQGKASSLRDRMEIELKRDLGVIIHGEPSARLPNTSFFTIPGVIGPKMAGWLDYRGVFVATGSACHGDSAWPSVLKKMGAAGAEAFGALRVSLSRYTESADIELFLSLLVEGAKHLRA